MAQEERVQRGQILPDPRTRRGRYQERAANAGKALRKNPNMTLGLFVVVSMTLMALFANVLATDDPTFVIPRDRLEPPSRAHPFGTDNLGREVYDRVVHGSRPSLQVGALVAMGTIVLGTLFGVVSGYQRVLDFFVMRIVDGLMAVPTFLLAIALMSMLGASMRNVIVVLMISSIPGTTRLVRSIVLSLRERDFVLAARALGGGPVRIMARHILPNTMPPVLVLASFIAGGAILSEAALSFLGAGLPAEEPSWGNMMGQGRSYNSIAIWMLFFPGLFLSITVLGTNLLGDGLRDTLDPRLRHLQ